MLFLTSNISGPRQNVKNWSVDFVSLVWELFLPIFSFQASKLWKEIEVTDRWSFLNNSSRIEQYKLPLTLLARDNSNAFFTLLNHKFGYWFSCYFKKSKTSGKAQSSLVEGQLAQIRIQRSGCRPASFSIIMIVTPTTKRLNKEAFSTLGDDVKSKEKDMISDPDSRYSNNGVTLS